MSAALQTSAQSGAAAFLARYEGLRGRLPGDAAVRNAAASSFRALGLPGIRQEAWKYTSLRPVAEAGFQEPLLSVDQIAPLLSGVPAITAPRLIFVDGRLRPDLSTPPPGLARSFARVPDFGRLARPEREAMVALNTMLAEDGASITVPEGMDAGTVLLVSLAGDAGHRPVAFHPRHAIRLGAGARLTVLEVAMGQGVYLHNPVMEIELGEGAALSHVRLQDESLAAFQLSTAYVEVAAGATYDGFVLNLGARLSRTEVHARLIGEGAVAHLNGAQLLRGTQHADLTTVLGHAAPGCASRQTVRHVLMDRARGVFQGRIEVARGAQKTDGYQMNQALLLSPEAEIDCKPELEIFADDVKCSHGATVGELDADQLFYLRSRGVPDAAARAILVRAFLAESLQAVAHPAIREALEAAIERWWERQAP